MATTLVGFVTQIFAGRAGLFTATVLPTSGLGPVVVQVSDIDGEPERFNERLTKIRLFRDAMNRAEPVIVVYEIDEKSGGNEVDSVKRLTRDHVKTGLSEQVLTGFVTGVRIREITATEANSTEASDVAEFKLVNPVGSLSASLTLALQRPERGTTSAMLRMIQDSLKSGDPIVVRTISAQGDQGTKVGQGWVVSVGDGSIAADGKYVDGFVESIGVGVNLGVPFARMEMTTAPPFMPSDHMLDPSFFHPKRIGFYVPEGSRMAKLLRDSLRSGLRVRVALQGNEKSDDSYGEKPYDPDKPGSPTSGDDGGNDAAYDEAYGATGIYHLALSKGELAGGAASNLVALQVELLAPLASAVRPVWVRVRKEALDAPPEAECVLPMPVSDLSPAGVASLQVPHNAAWEGMGCFNHGVYRIQIVAPVTPKVFVNGAEIPCLMMVPPPSKTKAGTAIGKGGDIAAAPSELQQVGAAIGHAWEVDKAPKLVTYHAHACLHDLNRVRVELDNWRCKHPFHIDVFKVV